MAAPVREWDATTYRRISVPHEEWARAVLVRLPLRGEEAVLDAGCGTGRVTRMLVERLPAGRVVAVDGSEAMVDAVRSVLREGDEALLADLTALELESPVDAVVSSAVFHWILDHDLLFARLRAALRDGGRLVAQCGGAGNIEELRASTREVAAAEPYAEHLRGMEEPWNYAGPTETEERLRRAGFEDAHCWLQPWDVLPPEPVEFVRTVCLGPHVDRLPGDLADRFVADVLAREAEPLRLRYVRLNIEATADPGE